MKQKIKALIMTVALLVCVLIPTVEVKADALSISLSSSSASIGDEIAVTVSVPSGCMAMVNLSYDTSVATFSRSGGGDVGGGEGAKSFTLGMSGANSATVYLKANSEGNCSITASAIQGLDANGNEVAFDAAGASFTVANAVADPGPSNEPTTGNIDTSSADNSLSNLTLSAGTLSPAFQYNVTNYTATVDYNVTNVAVSAVCSNASATIESVSGNENLQVGENTISIVVKAGNGVKATYKIVVTRKEQSDSDETVDNSEDNVISPSGTKGEFEVDGKVWVPIEVLPTEELPSDFTESTINLGGIDYPCLNYDKGNITLLYLIVKDSEESVGGYFVYDPATETVYPYVRLNSDEGYIIVLHPETSLIPEGYGEIALVVEGKGQILGYQTADTDNPDFYLIYGMNSQGQVGWYQYDQVEGTYQRAVLTESNVSTVSDEELTNLQKLNADLQTQVDKEKAKFRYLLIGVIMVFAILAVIAVNLFLAKREREEEDEEDDEGNDEETHRDEKSDEDFTFEHLNLDIEDGEQEESEEKEPEFYESKLQKPEMEGTKIEESQVEEFKVEEPEIEQSEIKELEIEEPKNDVETSSKNKDDVSSEKMETKKAILEDTKSTQPAMAEVEDFMDAILNETMEEIKADMNNQEKPQVEKAPEKPKKIQSVKASDEDDDDIEFLDL